MGAPARFICSLVLSAVKVIYRKGDKKRTRSAAIKTVVPVCPRKRRTDGVGKLENWDRVVIDIHP
jgi:hypothetical protein